MAQAACGCRVSPLGRSAVETPRAGKITFCLGSLASVEQGGGAGDYVVGWVLVG